MDDRQRLEKMPMKEQIKYVESKSDAMAFRTHHIKQSEHQGAGVASVSGIKEAMQAKAHFESQGKSVEIVGGTSKPYVIFR